MLGWERSPSFMRKLALASLIAFAATSWAGEGFLGTKPSSPASAVAVDAGGVGAMPFIQMLIALGIVLVLLKLVLPKAVAKLNKKIVTPLGSAIQVEESASFAGGNLYIVRARSKSLLLSVTTTGVQCLADLTEANPPPTFSDLVEREMTAVVEDRQPDIADALERLNRLAG